MLSSAVLLLPLLNAVLAAPLSLRQNQPDVDDGGIVFSPANASTVNTRSTFNFTYVTEDDDAASVDVALIKYIRIGQDFAASDNDDRRSVDVQVSLPADIAPGRYIIAVNEAENNDSNDDDDDDDDDDDEEESDGNVYVNNWSDFDLVSRNVNGVKNAYWITVANATSSIAQGGNDDADDTDGDDEVRLTSPTNGTVFTPGADFDFQYTCGDNCDIVRLALVRYHYVLNDTATAARGDNRWISTQITVPAGTPVDTYVVGVCERDATERDNANGGNDNDDDNDDDDDDDSSDDNDVNEDFYDRYFDYDISFKIPQSDDEGRFVIAVANGTTART